MCLCFAFVCVYCNHMHRHLSGGKEGRLEGWALPVGLAIYNDHRKRSSSHTIKGLNLLATMTIKQDGR